MLAFSGYKRWGSLCGGHLNCLATWEDKDLFWWRGHLKFKLPRPLKTKTSISELSTSHYSWIHGTAALDQKIGVSQRRVFANWGVLFNSCFYGLKLAQAVAQMGLHSMQWPKRPNPPEVLKGPEMIQNSEGQAVSFDHLCICRPFPKFKCLPSLKEWMPVPRPIDF